MWALSIKTDGVAGKQNFVGDGKSDKVKFSPQRNYSVGELHKIQ